MTAQVSIPGEREHPSLAFVNSRHNGRTGPVEHLDSPAALGEWLAWRSLLGRPSVAGAGGASERGAAAGGAGPSDADLATALALRAAIRELLVAAIEGRTPEPTAVATVNEAAARAPGAERLRWDAERGPQRMRARPGASDVAGALAALGEDAIELLCSDRRADLIACGAPGCVRLLLKDHPRRHWCSTRCGDRVRAARHYRRTVRRSVE
jgi:predicted RNA-binding Zn ribbon-like protein